MPRHAVDLEALRSVVDELASFQAMAEERVAAVDARVVRLHTTWSGQAAAAQLAAHWHWLRAAGDMRDGLAAMRLAAGTAHGNYSAAVATNVTMWV